MAPQPPRVRPGQPVAVAVAVVRAIARAAVRAAAALEVKAELVVA